MLALDVNVLIIAHREDQDGHTLMREWLKRVLAADEPFAIPEIVFSGFIRIVTNPRVYNPPSTMEQALGFCEQLRGRPNFVGLEPGPSHWAVFTRLCMLPGVRGPLVADAYLAAIAIESGCEWASTDGDFARFPGLRWRHPLA